ncbi:hypothetical protein [Alkaliphilus serpentinus]|uniref:Uncharacterized protein n=1 Tax=Alkaliphilus serpentinus TaxID=1482731 RepID=A0A833HM52_9FIRM|nr:hypothetical protein [Alkaliphilus serpentinus]KAB3525733.1 hypothetical protein F8153_14620 [Alkaliphilus serpentinus]
MAKAIETGKMQEFIDKYDEYFIFDVPIDIESDNKSTTNKTEPAIQTIGATSSDYTASDFEVVQKLAYSEAGVEVDESSGVFNKIMDDLLSIGVGYYTPVAGAVYSAVGYFTDDNVYFTSNIAAYILKKESVSAKRVKLKLSDGSLSANSYAYADIWRRYDRSEVDIYNDAGELIKENEQGDSKLARMKYQDIFMDNTELKQAAADALNRGGYPPAYPYYHSSANDIKYNLTNCCENY